MSSAVTVDGLPDEIILLIFEHLATEPAPSEAKFRHEPSLHLTDSASHVLKDVSRACWRWRRIVRPLLFSHSRVRLDQDRAEWKRCSLCSDDPWDAYDAWLSRLEYASEEGEEEQQRPSRACFRFTAPLASPPPDLYHGQFLVDRHSVSPSPTAPQDDASLQWARRLYHSMLDYLDFVDQNGMQRYIRSVVVYTADMKLRESGYNGTESPAYHNRAATAMWHLLYSTITPTRIVMVASPRDLADLTSCMIHYVDSWAFSDMEYHALELRNDSPHPLPTLPLPRDFRHLVLLKYPQCSGVKAAETSVLSLRPWTHLGLNEGSFLRAYATYEFFERGPPSLIQSIQAGILETVRTKCSTEGLGAVRSFQYTAIFPFASHVASSGILPRLEELDMQLAPLPGSYILSDKDRIGKADLADCWQELLTAYRMMTRQFQSFGVPPELMPKLQKFVCRDAQLPLARPDLDDVFMRLCLPVWAEYEPGVFTRLCDKPSHDDYNAE